MAYVSQELKAELSPAIKLVCKKYGIKASIAVRHKSTLVVNIKSGVIDFINDYHTTTQSEFKTDHLDINQYWYNTHFTGVAFNFLDELYAAMRGTTWFDKSDIQSDYFHTAYYMDINVGQWDKPYQLTK